MVKKQIANIIVILFSIIVTITNQKIGFINIPTAEKMLEFQFNLFTISSVLAGFSFTVLGLLLTLFSEKIQDKLKNTTIVTKKSSKIAKSIIYFGVSALISLLFIIGIADLVDIQNNYLKIKEFLFVGEIVSIFAGLIYFLKAMKGVYILIQKLYGCDMIEIQHKKELFEEELKKQK